MHVLLLILTYNLYAGYPIFRVATSPILFSSNIPYIYKDPEVYDPERFGPSREEDKSGAKFSYLSFGGGRHACMGEAYAYTQIKVVWSYLLRLMLIHKSRLIGAS
jgi:sterol 14alpha-demethylase